MRFIQIEGRYINIDHIVSIDNHGRGIGYETVIHLSNGQEIQTILSMSTVMEKITEAGKEVSR